MNLDLLLSNLSSPALLFFALGIFAVQVKSDLNIPENSSKLVLHDPKVGKVLVGLKEADIAKATIASNKIAIKPEVGDLIFINSWLNHSFDRHASDEQFKFIHFNISVKPK
jgi:hypothetical protein